MGTERDRDRDRDIDRDRETHRERQRETPQVLSGREQMERREGVKRNGGG